MVIAPFVGSVDITVGTSWEQLRSEDFTNASADGALPAGLKLREVALINKHDTNDGHLAAFAIAADAARTDRITVAPGAALSVELDGSSSVVAVAGSGAGTTLHLIAKWEA